MEITTCPECVAETFNAGLAFWQDSDEAVVVFECSAEGCGWAGVALEYWATSSAATVASAA